MFSGVNEHLPLQHGMNALELEFLQASDAAIDYHGRNRFPFNRLFAVYSTGMELSRIRSHSNGTSIAMSAGALCFMSENSDLEFSFRQDTRFFAFHYRVSIGEYNLFAGYDLLTMRPGAGGIVERLYRLFRQEPPSPAALCELKSLVLQETVPFLPADSLPPPQHQRYRPVLAFVREHADARTTVGELAKLSGSSADAFSRSFSRDFGMTVKHLLNTELTLKAGKLLQCHRHSVKEVASLLRFNDEYYFSRFFKKSTGLPPREYRNKFCDPATFTGQHGYGEK